MCKDQVEKPTKPAQLVSVVVPDSNTTATLQLSSNVGDVTVKVYGNRFCAPNPNGTFLANLNEKNDFSNPVTKQIKVTSDAEIVFTFYYHKSSVTSKEFCPTTLRFTAIGGKVYHAHYDYKDGWCKSELLTFVDEKWEKYLFANTNEDICLDESDLNLIKGKLPILIRNK